MSAISTAPDAGRLARLLAVRLYLIASFDGSPQAGLLHAIGEAAEAGVGAVQVRLKTGDSAARRALLRSCRACVPARTLLIVNDDLDAVFDAGGTPLADGVHLGRADAARLAAGGVLGGGPGTGPGTGPERGPERRPGPGPGLTAARARLGPDLLLGTSTRDRVELGAALAAGADHVGFGAVAASTTKSDTSPADPRELRVCMDTFPGVPIFPIGGLGPETLGLVTRVGCRRAAVGSAILQAPDPAAAAAALLAALDA